MYVIKSYGGVSHMNHSNLIDAVRNEAGISKHVHITHLNSPAIFETENGVIGMVLKCEGVTFDVEKDEVLNHYKFLLHRAITLLDDHFAIFITTHRHKEKMSQQGEFESDFLRDLDAKYHAQFQNSQMYTNDIYITIIFKGITSGKIGKGLNFVSRLKNTAIKKARESARQNQIKSLSEKVSQIKSLLSVFNPRIIGENDPAVGYSELLYFVSLFVNAGNGIKRQYAFSSPISKNIKDTKKITSHYPDGNVAQYLSTKYLFFGDTIQFQGSVKSDHLFASIVSIKRYGQESASIMFDTLLHLDCDFISTHSYAVESKDIVLDFISRHMRRMKNVDDPAVSQVDELHNARDLIASERVTMGYHHNTVMLLANTKEELVKNITQCIKCYSDTGFVAVRETIGQEAAFWAQIPGNFKYIARSSLVTSENFVDFAPLHNYRTGYSDKNHLGGCVTILETPSKTPYRFNFHIRGSRENPSKGHTILIGGNNSGKTTLMTFLDAQASRYLGNTFYFDRDRGADIYIRAVGGKYSILSPSHQHETQFAPLQLDDTAENRQFNRDLLIRFCMENDDDILSSDVIEMLTDCVHYAFDHLSAEHRTFSAATKILPIHFEKWPSLRRFLKSDGKYHGGDYAYLFDNYTDALNLHTKVGFDLTHFLDYEPPHIRTVLMMYLFHRVDIAINDVKTNHLTSVYLDEGWQYLSDDYWKEKLSRVLPTWRKKNAHIVIGTQSPNSVVHSAIRHVIMDNIATQIYFANPQAKSEDYIDGLKLTESEFDMIRKNTPDSRLFLLKQEHDSVICRLNLSTMPEVLSILSGNTKSVVLCDEARSLVGDDPQKWIPIFLKRVIS